MTFQAQAWICPVCIDDHGGRDCKPEDLKGRIAELERRLASEEKRADLNSREADAVVLDMRYETTKRYKAEARVAELEAGIKALDDHLALKQVGRQFGPAIVEVAAVRGSLAVLKKEAVQ